MKQFVYDKKKMTFHFCKKDKFIYAFSSNVQFVMHKVFVPDLLYYHTFEAWIIAFYCIDIHVQNFYKSI